MYTQNKPQKTSIKVNQGYQGETIEQKINRIVNNKEPIKDGAPLIYTERKDGVLPAYDIRTDRFEVAVDAMDKVTKTDLAKRDQRIGEKAFEGMTIEQKEEHIKKHPNSKHKDWKKPETGANTSDKDK